MYRVIKIGTIFVLQRKCKYLFLDIDDGSEEEMIKKCDALSKEYERKRKILLRYGKKI